MRAPAPAGNSLDGPATKRVLQPVSSLFSRSAASAAFSQFSTWPPESIQHSSRGCQISPSRHPSSVSRKTNELAVDSLAFLSLMRGGSPITRSREAARGALHPAVEPSIYRSDPRRIHTTFPRPRRRPARGMKHGGL